MTVVELFLKGERKEKKAQKSERKWENQMSLQECWETRKSKISPTPNKSFPKDLLEALLSVSDDDATSYIFLCVFRCEFLFLFISC